ncbi:MAG: PspC domain-containing protein [Oscillospiraceae bacterium]
MMKKLYRSNHDKMLCGVLGGVSEYFNVDPTLIRLAYAGISIFTAGFPGIIFYVVAAIVIPQAPFDPQ